MENKTLKTYTLYYVDAWLHDNTLEFQAESIEDAERKVNEWETKPIGESFIQCVRRVEEKK